MLIRPGPSPSADLRNEPVYRELIDLITARDREIARATQTVAVLVAAAYTVRRLDRLLLVDTTGGAVTVTLPLAQNFLGEGRLVVKQLAGGNAVTLQRAGTDLIHPPAGAAAATLVWNTIGLAYDVVPCMTASPATYGWVTV